VSTAAIKPAPSIGVFENTTTIITFTVTDADGVAKDVTGYEFEFQIFAEPGSATKYPTSAYNVGSGIVLTTPTSGIITVTLADTDVASVTTSGDDFLGIYELVEYSGGSIAGAATARLRGRFTIRANDIA